MEHGGKCTMPTLKGCVMVINNSDSITSVHIVYSMWILCAVAAGEFFVRWGYGTLA